MRFSYQLLREWLPHLSVENLEEYFSVLGFEVESKEEFLHLIHPDVLVGYVESVESIAGSDHLSFCQVKISPLTTLPIVCGAKNVRAGIKVAVAIPGAMVQGVEITQRTLLGVESSGMICSLKELGLPQVPNTGIWILEENAPLGMPISSYLAEKNGQKDTLYQLYTPYNRSDVLSHFHLARNLMPLAKDGHFLEPLKQDSTIPIQSPSEFIAQSDYTSVYSLGLVDARAVDTAERENTPLWLKKNLWRYNIPSVHFMVDVSNYLLHQYGQPVHIWDADTLELPLRVYPSTSEFMFETIREESILVPSGTLAIWDNRGECVALAGIVGSKKHAVKSTSQRFLIECAIFDRTLLQKTLFSQPLLHTDASEQMSKGISEPDFFGCMSILYKMIQQQYGENSILKIESTLASTPSLEPFVIPFTMEKLDQFLGFSIPQSFVESLFLKMGWCWNTNTLSLPQPSLRHDISRPEDIYEEIVRYFGYRNIPTGKYPISFENSIPASPLFGRKREFRKFLLSQGFHEVYHSSFLETSQGTEHHVHIQNPLGKNQAYLRQYLMPTLIDDGNKWVLQHFLPIRSFELGHVFYQDESGIQEKNQLALFATEQKYPKDWQNQAKENFYTWKSLCENLLRFLHIPLEEIEYIALSSELEEPSLHGQGWYHPYQSAKILWNGVELGRFGQIHPEKREKKISMPFFGLEIWDIDVLLQHQFRIHKSEEFSVQPQVIRDFSCLLPRDTALGEVLHTLQKTQFPHEVYLKSVYIKDIFSSPEFPPHMQAVTFSLILQSAHETLNDELIHKIFFELIATVEKQFQGVLRDGKHKL